MSTATAHMPVTHERSAGYPLVDAEWGEDPLAGIPAELVDRVGVLDHDTAGGCG
ncbi:hypothetical protein ACGFW5_09960 [Streptomyces sp. NPDC048416]|uniref:hypothetical protein n=1 Tax=Streptomyces sp. NPDC048416 TaxID=3365546 RepID=UPI003719E690